MASDLDDEIEALEARAATLKRTLAIHTSTLLTAPSTLTLLTPPPSALSPLPLPQPPNPPASPSLLTHLHAQRAHHAQSLYRACAGLTTFRARDPDPHAVDAGAVLGLRVEAASSRGGGGFLRSYFVLLNRPYGDGAGALRVHRHTVPACIPLAALAARYLPAPARGGEGGGGDGGKRQRGRGQQDLAMFVRCLRREVAGYHARLAGIGDLRRAVELEGGRGGAGTGRRRSLRSRGVEEEASVVVHVSAADAEAKHVKIEWADGRTGRLVLGEDGTVVKMVVIGETGRDRGTVRELLEEGTRVEDVVKKLQSV